MIRPGQQERPPSVRSVSRSLRSTNVTQRPSPYRFLSQQFPSSSPTRRTPNEGFVDLDGPVGMRTIPRSRLNFEIGKGQKDEEMVESPKPTSQLTPTWKPPQRPRGRPQLHFDVPSISNPSPRPSQEHGNDTAIKPMPLPVRPVIHAPPPAKVRSRQAPPVVVKKGQDPRPKPFTLEVPAAAPRYKPDGHADFFPWTGNHPEDRFSGPVIRQGYMDKSQMTLNETGSARASIFPALKHKSGLHTLSSLFTTVLAQRRAHGQISTTSTFKPPPRVTVTDTKREMWLKELAGSTTPLRRLSRSIPHGIRGKVLLDQALSKRIPIERAAWLAKCVGANELRAQRRKGATGTTRAFSITSEAKWIRDFTICVEQFLESVAGSCGEPDFKTRVNYAIRLAAYFHNEHLLEREHYLEWLLTSLETCTQAKLPMWLIITQIYWKDMLQYRKYGRRLAATLIHHLAETLNHVDRDILEPLSERLKFLLKGVISSSWDSFVSPDVWAKHEDLLRMNLAPGDERFTSILAHIGRRNKAISKRGSTEDIKPRRQLIKTLDSTISTPFPSELPQKCWDIDSDKDLLAKTVIDWATSSHRPGVGKIFAAARILRTWSRKGVDVTDALLQFLDSGICESRARKSTLYHLASELARSEHFSTARYLQWLIARGGIFQTSDVAEDGPCATRLLAELPTHNLSDGILELRETVLSRVDFKMDAEEERTRDCIVSMNRTLPGMQGTVDAELESADHTISSTPKDLLSTASRTSKSEVGLWLRQKVKIQMLQLTIPPLDDWDDSPVKRGTSAITPSDFHTIRHYLDLTDDYSMLADVLKIVSSSNDAEVLASVADTINLHMSTLAAIGALKDLFDTLMARMRALAAEMDSVPRVFLVSLSDLASRLPEQKLVAQHLNLELARSDRKTAADACSPVSDHMALMQTAETDFTDEIEKVLASGNSMDQSTLERLFQRIILRLEESFDKSPEQQRSCGLLLTRLKTFDTIQFNVLMNSWVARFLQLQSRPRMVQILGPLISFGCLALPDVIVALNSIIAKDPDALNSQEALALMMASATIPEAMSVEEAYRLRLKQAQIQTDQPHEVLQIIARAVAASSSTGKEIETSDVGSPDMFELLRKFVLLDTELTSRDFVKPLVKNSGAKITSIVDTLLLGYEAKSSITTEDILIVADDLTLPFCKIKLATMFKTEDSIMSGTDGTPETLEALDAAIESAITAGRTSWASIVPLLDCSIARHLRLRAETQFLSLFPSPKGSNKNDPVSINEQLLQARNLLHIIDATAYSISDGHSPSGQSGPSEIAVTLNNLWLLLSSAQTQVDKHIIINSWLPLLLSFTIIHKHSFETTKAGQEQRGKTILGLAAIYLQLESLPAPKDTVTALAEQIFDFSMYLVDSLPDDVRVQCMKYLRETTSNPRIRYLFSLSANPTDWLVMVQRNRGPIITSNANNTGNSTTGGSEEGKLPEKEKPRPVPFPLKRWEMLQEGAPNVAENDTSLNLTLFGARKG